MSENESGVKKHHLELILLIEKQELRGQLTTDIKKRSEEDIFIAEAGLLALNLSAYNIPIIKVQGDTFALLIGTKH